MSNPGEEGKVQVALDGAGKNLRTVLLRQVLQADGTLIDVHVQCSAVVDVNGDSVDMKETNALLKAILFELVSARLMYGRATGQAVLDENAAGILGGSLLGTANS
jgi:hypothetical protein